MTTTRQINDGLINLTSGMGTTRDKGAMAAYAPSNLSDVDLLNAYRGSALIRRAIDLPAEDAAREWREWSADEDQITAIEAEERRLGVQGKVMRAQRLARLFGGSAIMIGDGASDPSQPINPATIRRGGLKYLTVMTTMDLSPDDIDRNPASADYGRPKRWTVVQTGQAVHPSRLVVFSGLEPLSDYGIDAHPGWGTSVLEGMLDALKRVDEGANNVNSLVYEAKVDVFKIPGLMQNLASRGDAYGAEVLRRLTLAATGKGISGALVMDADEQYEQKGASFGSLPDVIDRFCQLASAESGIPMTLLFGMSPGGLNSTGAGDIRGYYDRVRVLQTLQMQPAMTVLDECLIWSALGSRPPEVHFNWRPLWQPTALERAEVGGKLVDAAEKLHAMGVVPAEAVGRAVVNGLTESGAFPGLESAVDGHYGEIETDMGEDEASGDDAAEDLAEAVNPVGDAAPRTLYVRRDVLNGAEIIEWAKGQGFKTTLPAADLHVTIAYSRAVVDWMKAGQPWESKIELPEGGPRQMEQFGGARVLLFASNDLQWRHERLREIGASWDHAEYQPHITISYGDDSPDLRGVEPYRGRIVLGPEVFEEVNEDWAESISEE